MKIRKLRVSFFVWLILTLAVAFIIFRFSSHTAEVSGEISIGLAYRLFEKAFGATFAESMEGVLRKLAHFAVFFVFGFCLCSAIRSGNFFRNNNYSNLLCIVISFLYAASDEIHQYFVPGRYCSIKDVFIDTAGASCGMIAVFAVSFIIGKLSKLKRKI